MSATLLAMTVAWRVAAAAADLKIIVPAAPGGGWDQLGRGVQQTMQAAKLADRVQVSNAAGAGGTIGLAQLINNNKGDGSALMVSGKGMVSAIYINKSPVSLSNVTPIARLTGEYEVLVVPASSTLKTMADLVAMYKANPGWVSWAGGLAGGVDQLTAGMIVQAIGGENAKFNYVAFGSGGEVLAQTLGGHVTVGMGGYNEFAAQITVRQAARARDHLRQAPARRQHPDAEGAGHQRRVRQLARADGGARHQRSAAAGADQDGHANGEVPAVEGAGREERVARPVHGGATSSRPMSSPSRRTCSRSSTISVW